MEYHIAVRKLKRKVDLSGPQDYKEKRMSDVKLSKRQQIEILIDQGFDFDYVDSKNIAASSYVKAVFTKNGVEHTEEELEEQPDNSIIIIDDPEDLVDHANAVVILEELIEEPEQEVVEKPKPKKKSDKKNRYCPWGGKRSKLYLSVQEEAKRCLTSKKMSRLAQQFSKKYLTLINDTLDTRNFDPQRTRQVDCQYSILRPIPTPSSNTKELYHLQRNFKKLSKEIYTSKK
jgi:hypothetical protein